MPVYVLTSMFEEGFSDEITQEFKEMITERKNFAFVASDFYHMQEKTDKYFKFFYRIFTSKGIEFENTYVVDGRMTKKEAKATNEESDFS